MVTTEMGIGLSHAKAILSGEHSVVYGNPAIAFPVRSLSLRAEAELGGDDWVISTPYHTAVVRRSGQQRAGLAKVLAEAALVNTLEFLGSDPSGIAVRVTGEIPPARGLGSSAAVAAAIVTAVAHAHGIVLGEDEHFDIVQSVERVAHGTPSGLDARATIATGPIWFQRGSARPQVTRDAPRLVVADTGLKGHTAEAVTHVRELRERQARATDAKINSIGEVTVNAATALEQGDLAALGVLMTENHQLLASLGVSHPQLDNLVSVALQAGALGAKLTGGGKGGCIIALVEDRASQASMTERLLASGAESVWYVNGEEDAS